MTTLYKIICIEREGTNFFGKPFKEVNKIQIHIDMLGTYLARKRRFFPVESYNIEESKTMFKANSKTGDYSIIYKVQE